MHQFTDFGVAASNIHDVDGSQVNELLTLRHLHFASLSDGYHNGTLPPTPLLQAVQAIATLCDKWYGMWTRKK